MLRLFLFLMLASPIVAAEPAKPDVIAKLKALKPNHAVLLGKADVLGEFNDTAKRFNLHKTGPQSRDFTIKMCWAADRERVLFCGANHNVPHRINDVWEFDLGTLTWNMLYAPDNARDYTMLGKDYSDVKFRDGLFITDRGGPGIIAHTWWGLTYDETRHELLFMNTWVTDKKKCAELLKANPDEVYNGPPLWGFDPAKKTWKAYKQEKPYPVAIFGGLLEYIPDLKSTVWHANNWQMHGTWKYDGKANSWVNLKSNGDDKTFVKEAAEPEQVGYYDTKRHQLIIQRHKSTHHYDVKSNAWKKVIAEEKDSEKVPYGHDAFSPFYYDAKSGHGILMENKLNRLWAYDPEKTTWTKLQPEGDPMPTGNRRLAYCDPKHNVFVLIDGVTVWAYRYQ